MQHRLDVAHETELRRIEAGDSEALQHSDGKSDEAIDDEARSEVRQRLDLRGSGTRHLDARLAPIQTQIRRLDLSSDLDPCGSD